MWIIWTRCTAEGVEQDRSARILCCIFDIDLTIKSEQKVCDWTSAVSCWSGQEVNGWLGTQHWPANTSGKWNCQNY